MSEPEVKLVRFWSLPKGTRCRPPWLMWSWVKTNWCYAQYHGLRGGEFVVPWQLVEVIE